MFWARAAYLEKNVGLRDILEHRGSLETSWVGYLLPLIGQLAGDFPRGLCPSNSVTAAQGKNWLLG